MALLLPSDGTFPPLPKMESPERRLAVLWRHGEWRCEYWASPAGANLRLYMGDQLADSRRVVDADEMLRRSTIWREAVQEPDAESTSDTAVPRRLIDRRQGDATRRSGSRRGGRRRTDWLP